MEINTKEEEEIITLKDKDDTSVSGYKLAISKYEMESERKFLT